MQARLSRDLCRRLANADGPGHRELTLDVRPQVYRREGARTYRFESDGGAFRRLLEVNDAGFVTDYPGLWVQE